MEVGVNTLHIVLIQWSFHQTFHLTCYCHLQFAKNNVMVTGLHVLHVLPCESNSLKDRDLECLMECNFI